ncbi:MAG: EF-hand domain-containing protein [Advenella sp.]|uniref:EF-hand domain-containing protein n=1 Tax=Advenella sp. TaxID=1872388 RepID=UPI003F94CD15
MSNTFLRSKTAAALFAVSASLGSAMFLANSATAQTTNQGTGQTMEQPSGQAAPSAGGQGMPQAAMPSSGGEIPQDQLVKLDLNKDGAVGREEYNQAMAAAFKNLDKNSDNALTAEEVGTILTTEQFAAVDANKDGKISSDEMITQVTSDFDAADTNKDGQLK